MCTFPRLRPPVGKQIRGLGLNLTAVSALVEQMLKRRDNFVPQTAHGGPSRCAVGGAWCDGPCVSPGPPGESRLPSLPLRSNTERGPCLEGSTVSGQGDTEPLLCGEIRFLRSQQCQGAGHPCPVAFEVSLFLGWCRDGSQAASHLPNYVSRENPLASQSFVSSSVKK